MTPTTTSDWIVFAVQEIVELARAWPLAIAVSLFVFRKELAKMVSVVVGRIDDGSSFEGNAGPVRLKVGERLLRRFTAYGSQVKPGARITATFGERTLGSVTANEVGQWLLTIEDRGQLQEGDLIEFRDNEGNRAKEPWSPLGVPRDPQVGIRLTPTTATTSVRPTGGTGTGDPVAAGPMSIVSFTGTLDQLNAALVEKNLWKATAVVGGQEINWVVGAPSFVNAEFAAAFPSGLHNVLLIVHSS